MLTDGSKWTSIHPGGHSGPPLRGGFVIRPSTIKHLYLSTRRRVECGAGVPGAGHFSRRGLQASNHSASIRAGTVHDGHIQQIITKQPVVTIGDGRPTRQHHATDQRSRTENQTEFSSHPARSAHTRCIQPASASQTSMFSQSASIHTGGHSGPPLR